MQTFLPLYEKEGQSCRRKIQQRVPLQVVSDTFLVRCMREHALVPSSAAFVVIKSAGNTIPPMIAVTRVREWSNFQFVVFWTRQVIAWIGEHVLDTLSEFPESAYFREFFFDIGQTRVLVKNCFKVWTNLWVTARSQSKSGSRRTVNSGHQQTLLFSSNSSTVSSFNIFWILG